MLTNEGYNDEKLYYACDGVYLDGGLKSEVTEAIEYIDTYAKDNYLKQNTEEIINALVIHFDIDTTYAGNGDGYLTAGFIKDKVCAVRNEIESNTALLF